MRRAIPLLKMILRMAVFGAMLGAGLGLLAIALFGETVPAPQSHFFARIMRSELLTGAILGAATGLAMALYTALLHRDRRNPRSFRQALVIVATAASLALIEAPLGLSFVVDEAAPLRDLIAFISYDSVFALLLLAAIGKHAVFALMAWQASGSYLKEAWRGAQPNEV